MMSARGFRDMRNAKRYALAALAGALAIAAVVAGFALRGGADDGHLWPKDAYGENMPEPAGGIYLINDMYWLAPGAGEAARRSDLIILAAVAKRLDPFWTTPDRLRPNLTERQLMMRPQFTILTPYEVRVKSVLKGEAEGGETFIINRLGGQVGKDVVAAQHDPFTLVEGAEAVLFLRDCGDIRIKRFNDVGERFRIIDRIRLDKNREPLDGEFSYSELAEIVAREGALEAKGGIIPC